MKAKFLILFILSFFLSLNSYCQEKEIHNSIALVTDIGGIDDQSFNQMTWEGLQGAESELGIDISFLESRMNMDYITNLDTAHFGLNDLIVGVGFMMSDAVLEAAEKYPNQNFVILDNAYEVTPVNLSAIVFEAEEASFLAGYVAGRMTETGVVGFIGGIKFFLVEEYEYGFKAGLKQAGGDIQTITMYAESFTNAERGKYIANRMYQKGADIIFHCAGGVGNGLMEAAMEQGKWAIGVDRDQSYLAPDNVLASAVKRFDNAIVNFSKNFVEGHFSGGKTISYGLADGGVDLLPTSHVSDEILQEVDRLKQMIINNVISVPNTEDTYKAYIQVPME